MIQFPDRFLVMFGALAVGGFFCLSLPPFHEIERGFYKSSAAVFLTSALVIVAGKGVLVARSAAPTALSIAELAAWATFLPSFVFIFLGAPYVERIAGEPRIAGALAAITAAVVGIIGTLALLFARVVLLPNGLDAGPAWSAMAIAVAVWVLLTYTRIDLPWILAAAAAAGYLVG